MARRLPNDLVVFIVNIILRLLRNSSRGEVDATDEAERRQMKAEKVEVVYKLKNTL